MNRDAARRRLNQVKSIMRRLEAEAVALEAVLMKTTESGKRSRKVVPPCGTESAYQRHRNRGEPQDDACLRAHRIYNKAGHMRRARRLV